MITARDAILLDVTYDLVSEIHTDIFNSTKTNNREEMLKDTFDIMRRICWLTDKLKEMQ